MRICLYTTTALPKMGGHELVVDALARQLTALGQDVVVLAPMPRRPLRPEDAALPYRVVRHPRFYSSRHLVSWYRWWLLRLHRAERFDVLHSHGVYPTGWVAALSRGPLGIPLVITSHGDDVREGNHRLADPVLRARHVEALAVADAVVAISRFTRDGYRRLCPQVRRVVDIPNGVDLEPFSSPAERPNGLDGAIQPGRYALFLGRLHRRKGVDVLLDALALLPSRGGVELVIAGEGDERSALEEQAERRRLTGRVRFVGRAVGAVKTYLLQNALGVVVPSRTWEAFPLVVLEGQAAGAPMIGTRVPGLEDLIEPGRTGWLTPPEAPSHLAEALAELFAQPAAARMLGEQGRRRAVECGWPAIARRHLDLYEELRAPEQHQIYQTRQRVELPSEERARVGEPSLVPVRGQG